jgi:hypothetical protein
MVLVSQCEETVKIADIEMVQIRAVALVSLMILERQRSRPRSSRIGKRWASLPTCGNGFTRERIWGIMGAKPGENVGRN